MGMGYGPYHAWVISYEDLVQLCPQEIAKMESLEDFDDWHSVAMGVGFEDDQGVSCLPPTVSEALEELCSKFQEVTGGLKLSLIDYDSDSGDRYDEVTHTDGCVFTVDNMVQLTPAGEKFKHIVSEQGWVQFG